MSGDGKTRGQVGYEAYARSTGGKTFDGRAMPVWTELPDRIQTAWACAAEAILDRWLGPVEED